MKRRELQARRRAKAEAEVLARRQDRHREVEAWILDRLNGATFGQIGQAAELSPQAVRQRMLMYTQRLDHRINHDQSPAMRRLRAAGALGDYFTTWDVLTGE